MRTTIWNIDIVSDSLEELSFPKISSIFWNSTNAIWTPLLPHHLEPFERSRFNLNLYQKQLTNPMIQWIPAALHPKLITSAKVVFSRSKHHVANFYGPFNFLSQKFFGSFGRRSPSPLCKKNVMGFLCDRNLFAPKLSPGKWATWNLKDSKISTYICQICWFGVIEGGTERC